MRNFLIAFFLCIVSTANAQLGTMQTINVPLSLGGTTHAGIWFPQEYSGTTKSYPLLIFLHGSGESGTNLATIYNSTTAGGPVYYVTHGLWPNTYTNPVTGAQEQYIVFMPQTNNGWSSSGDDVESYVTYLFEVLGYRIDINRIVVTGLSSGGGGSTEFAAHLNGDENNNNGSARKYKACFIFPMSSATNRPISAWGVPIANDNIPAWYFGDPINDVYGEFSDLMNTYINAAKAGLSRITGNPPFNTGHGPWNSYYNPTRTESFTLNGITFTNVNPYQVGLAFNRSGVAPPGSPTCSAGNPQTISAGGGQATLVGTATPSSGQSITAYAWTVISSPVVPSITSPTASTTAVSGMTTAGVYQFQLKVTQTNGQTATSTVSITASPQVVAVITPGSQTVVIPTGQTSGQAIVNGLASVGQITGYTWYNVSGPNTPTILNSQASSTTYANLIVGTYTIGLWVNPDSPGALDGASFATATITVTNSNPAPGCGSKQRHVITPDPVDSTYFLGASQANNVLKPGDTIIISHGAWNYVEVDSFIGNPACPLVIMNDTGTTPVKLKQQIKLYNTTYVKVTGKGDPRVQYGIKIEYDSVLRWQGIRSHAIEISASSKSIEVENIDMHNVDIGIVCEGVGTCDPKNNFPNWIVDSMKFHDNRIVGTWNEGMYIGNTSPDNAGNDLRPVYCAGIVDCGGPGPGCVVTFPAPAKNGYTLVYNNIVDSTGRGGIQLSNAASNVSEIYNNTVKHNGLNGDDAQGSGIVTGLYTRVYIHDNTIVNTYTWAISSIGSGATNIPIRIENNTTDSSGFLTTYDLSTTSRDHYDPRTEPTFRDSLPWPQVVEVDTRPHKYISGGGTATPGLDSTQFYIKNCIFGLKKNTVSINIDNSNTLIQHSGNIICSNVNKDGSTVQIFSAPGVTYTTTCTGNPIVSVDGNSSLVLPVNFTNLTSSVSTQGGATITSYSWVKTSGSNTFTISPMNTANTQVSNLVAGTYVFTLTVTDSNGLQGSGFITVVVTSGVTPPVNNTKKIPLNLKHIIKTK